jgi:hypothetical protein
MVKPMIKSNSLALEGELMKEYKYMKLYLE